MLQLETKTVWAKYDRNCFCTKWNECTWVTKVCVIAGAVGSKINWGLIELLIKTSCTRHLYKWALYINVLYSFQLSDDSTQANIPYFCILEGLTNGNWSVAMLQFDWAVRLFGITKCFSLIELYDCLVRITRQFNQTISLESLIHSWHHSMRLAKIMRTWSVVEKKRKRELPRRQRWVWGFFTSPGLWFKTVKCWTMNASYRIH